MLHDATLPQATLKGVSGASHFSKQFSAKANPMSPVRRRVVTQLPVPSRIGMLRFEQLNGPHKLTLLDWCVSVKLQVNCLIPKLLLIGTERFIIRDGWDVKYRAC